MNKIFFSATVVIAVIVVLTENRLKRTMNSKLLELGVNIVKTTSKY